jgi:uncharacterized protein
MNNNPSSTTESSPSSPAPGANPTGGADGSSARLSSARLRRLRRPIALAGATLLGVVGFGMTRTPDPVAAQGTTTSATTASVRSVIVTGVGKVSVIPDRLFLNLGVETRSLRVADALKANNKAAQDLIKVLKDRGVADKDIKTSQLSIYPQFDSAGRRITAYQVNNSVVATVRNVATSGDIIDAAATVAGDAIRINGLDFGIGDPSGALATARDLAVKDAKTQAEQLAKSAGVKLGKLRTITTASDTSDPTILRQNAVSSDVGSSAPISAGSQDVLATVQLVYDIVE